MDNDILFNPRKHENDHSRGFIFQCLNKECMGVFGLLQDEELTCIECDSDNLEPVPAYTEEIEKLCPCCLFVTSHQLYTQSELYNRSYHCNECGICYPVNQPIKYVDPSKDKCLNCGESNFCFSLNCGSIYITVKFLRFFKRRVRVEECHSCGEIYSTNKKKLIIIKV